MFSDSNSTLVVDSLSKYSLTPELPFANPSGGLILAERPDKNARRGESDRLDKQPSFLSRGTIILARKSDRENYRSGASSNCTIICLFKRSQGPDPFGGCVYTTLRNQSRLFETLEIVRWKFKTSSAHDLQATKYALEVKGRTRRLTTLSHLSLRG